MRVRWNLVIAVVSGCLVLASCGSPPTSSSATPPPAAGTAAAPTTVRLLTHESFVVSEQLLADFTAQTGIRVEVLAAGDAGSMVAGAVLAAGAPTADVLFGVDNTLLSRAVDAGVFAPYTSSELPSLEPFLQSDTAGGLVTPVDYGDVCVNIDDAYFAKGQVPAPASLSDLTDPKYRDLLVVEDPASSSPGLAFLLATIAQFGDDWPTYWDGLRQNGVKVAASWTDAYVGSYTQGGGEGDRPLVVSYATSPPAEIVYADEPKPAKPSSSVMTDGCYRQVEYAGVLAGTENQAEAQKVVDWLISAPVQADVPLSMFVFPARRGIERPAVFERFAAKVTKPLQLSATEVASGLPTWLETWSEVMGR